MKAYAGIQQLNIEDDKIELGAYHVRVMLSHLRNAKMRPLKPPKQYAALSAVIAKIRIHDESEDHGGGDDDDKQDDNDDGEVAFIPSGPPPVLVELSSEEEIGRPAVSMDDFDELSQELFHSKASDGIDDKEKVKNATSGASGAIDGKSKVKNPTSGASGAIDDKSKVKNASSGAIDNSKALGAVDDEEMGHLLSLCGAKGPLPAEYRKKFAKNKDVLKKPASAKPVKLRLNKKTVDPRWHQQQTVDPKEKKRIYSRAYHAEVDRCMAKKMSSEAAKNKGRLAAGAAVEKWLATLKG